MLKAFVVVAVAIPTLVCCVLLPFIGSKALLSLIFVGVGPVFGVIYGLVGKKVARLCDSIPPHLGTAMPGLIVQGAIQSPGMVIQGTESLILQPIVGKRSETKLSEIASVREVTCFNGSLLVGKTGFRLTVPDRRRLACAVPNSYVRDFKAWLSAGMRDGP